MQDAGTVLEVLLVTGEPSALKGAHWVRREAAGKGPHHTGRDLAAQPTLLLCLLIGSRAGRDAHSPTFRFSGRPLPKSSKYLRASRAVAGRCRLPLVAAVAVTVAVSSAQVVRWQADPDRRAPGPRAGSGAAELCIMSVSRALVAGSKHALASGSRVAAAAGGGRWLLMAIRGHLGGGHARNTYARYSMEWRPSHDRPRELPGDRPELAGDDPRPVWEVLRRCAPM